MPSALIGKCRNAMADAIAPSKRLPLSSWTDEHFRLSPEASAQPGRWQCLPFQREPLDAIAPQSPYEQVVLLWASQMSKSSLLLAFISNVIVDDPGPILCVQPNLDMSNAFSKDRLSPMFRDMPVLSGLVSDPKGRDAGSTIAHRKFIGGHLTIVGANSPAGLASRPIRYLCLDEVDRYPESAGAEGDSASLAIARTRTFWNRKIIWTSSPTIKNISRIEAAFLESDQREYEVPCPLCGVFQVLTWRRVEWPEHEPENAFYRCSGCDGVVHHHQKAEMVRTGRWIAKNPGAKIAGFRLSELVSPWRSWGELAVEFLKAMGNPERLRAFINTSLAELWDDAGQSNVSEVELLRRVENWGPMLPDLAPVITCGVDVQDNRLELSVYAWGRGEESWLLMHRVIPGDPSTPALWAELDKLLATTWNHSLLGPVPIHVTCIDSGGHFTNAVCKFAEDRRGRRVFATKGMAGSRPIWPRKESKAPKGKVWVIGVDSAKQMVSQRLKIGEGAGRIHWPASCDLRFFEQMCSEYVCTTYKRGRPERAWVRKQGRAAEAWDCAVYAYTALQALAAHGINVDAEVAKVEMMQESGSLPPVRPRVTRSRWMEATL